MGDYVYSVFKWRGLETKKFKNIENALKFWNNNKDYNSLKIMIPETKMFNGKKKKVYRSRYIKWRR